MIVTIVGTGLIGGSMALDLRAKHFATKILGVEKNKHHAKEAMMFGTVDEIETLSKSIPISDLIIIAIPVAETIKILPFILDKIKNGAVVTDVGSTKNDICNSVKNHPNRKQFVPSHPIAGTENSGPKAAMKNLFEGKMTILCNKKNCHPDAIALVKNMYEILGMKILFMDSKDHDIHVAYVSHISHISSFMLATTVLDMEKNTSTIFNLAGSGFASTVRLGKSSPEMWAPIFLQNSKNISQALGTYIKELTEFKNFVDEKDYKKMFKAMKKANGIRKVLEGKKL